MTFLHTLGLRATRGKHLSFLAATAAACAISTGARASDVLTNIHEASIIAPPMLWVACLVMAFVFFLLTLPLFIGSKP